MLNSTLNTKVLTKRINRQLNAHFFTLEEFKELSDRRANKVIKLIAKIENIKLSKEEIKSITSFIKNSFNTQEGINSTSLLWDFVVDAIETKEYQTNEFAYENDVNRIFNYRFNKFDLLRM